ncbi:MAG: inner membrane CreD family protein [Polyangiaceae bacterium]|nr:inner membrane CreD family protein [Polyangiaceae bacterium]
MKRLIAIFVIWLGCAVAWVVLGSALVVRSGEASSEITSEVQKLWGPPMQQMPPQVFKHQAPAVVVEQGASRENLTPAPEVALAGSNIAVRLDLTHRQKGLLWFPTYDVEFAATYTFSNDSMEDRNVVIEFPLQPGDVVYDGFLVTDGENQPVEVAIRDGAARFEQSFAPGERRDFGVKYKSRGTSQWQYALTAGTGKVKQFRLSLDTNFEQIDFLPGSLSPSEKSANGAGFHADWNFDSLIASSSIGMELPQKVNPGPLATRITFFAPVGLLFFFFVVAIFSAAQKREIHPLNYLFFGCAFFAYHLLFSYLVDHLEIGPSLAIASVVSVLLLVTYARLFVGWKFALREMGIAQSLYLVLFSVTFLWKGFTGLSISWGAILSLFVMMQVTGRAKWNEALAPRGKLPKAPGFGPAGESANEFVDGPTHPYQNAE